MSIAFSISSTIFMAILIIVFFFKERIKTEETTIFSSILICTFVGLLLEMASFICLQFGYDDSSLLFVFISKLIIVYYYV